jgi:hypothetical protein
MVTRSSAMLRFMYVAHLFRPDLTLLLNPLNSELNPICHLLALAGAHHFVDVVSVRVNKIAHP